MDERKTAPGTPARGHGASVRAAGADPGAIVGARGAVADLRRGLDAEAALFGALVAEVEALEQAYHARDWTSSITVAQGLDGHARRIEAAESDRQLQVARLAAELGLPAGSALSAIVVRLGADDRTDLEEGGRRLRTAVFRLKTATVRLRWSAETLSGTLERVLAGVFPHRRGRIYGRHGTPRQVGESVLVDHSL